jgi:hypothetical protein
MDMMYRIEHSVDPVSPPTGLGDEGARIAINMSLPTELGKGADHGVGEQIVVNQG